ncbi:virulence RhuM family protein [Aliarcobacter cryaerophilus]|uniref:virulence RhuM family protein n=1 Tax=Aliarcobacter cryaerophilus TaxID=28198 RepID=UPI0021B5D033|nr:virulence RhuM family protein [Aliarcobacter cryaerophilus]MCT7509570.1 virulence RhuM family protein [Aliarcobacter cryaerophilus]
MELTLSNQSIAIYKDGELELKTSIDSETIWLTQKQIAELFDKDIRTINEHIKFIYKEEEELVENSTIRNFRIVQKEGNREVARDVLHYNLDVIISIGYRANSKKATKFRQWATSVLKEYIFNGYAINSHKITEQRLLNLENDMQVVKSKFKNYEPQQNHIFYNGQIFDAYLFVSDIIKSAKSSIKLIDNYIDESTLVLFTKRDAKVDMKIYTKTISKQLKLDLEKHNAQYPKIDIEIFDLSHDRFLIIDEKDIYHFGASLKDLGKKWFAVSLMDINSFEILEKLNRNNK